MLLFNLIKNKNIKSSYGAIKMRKIESFISVADMIVFNFVPFSAYKTDEQLVKRFFFL